MIESAPSVQAAEGPALAISYINDPIAVPYLERALHASGPGALEGGLVVQGLGRIENDDSVRVLISALDMTDMPMTSINAWTTLATIEAHTDDPVRKMMIEKAVNSYEFKDGQLRKKPHHP